eukprot:GDKK01062820.1.p2 GENE.GDKK01062820.1~~GDKK01062820.1.p2  ORF type:complete len:121 (+),score=5.88 GDKK01062820.1:423-785(+)
MCIRQAIPRGGDEVDLQLAPKPRLCASPQSNVRCPIPILSPFYNSTSAERVAEPKAHLVMSCPAAARYFSLPDTASRCGVPIDGPVAKRSLPYCKQINAVVEEGDCLNHPVSPSIGRGFG